MDSELFERASSYSGTTTQPGEEQNDDKIPLTNFDDDFAVLYKRINHEGDEQFKTIIDQSSISEFHLVEQLRTFRAITAVLTANGISISRLSECFEKVNSGENSISCDAFEAFIESLHTRKPTHPLFVAAADHRNQAYSMQRMDIGLFGVLGDVCQNEPPRPEPVFKSRSMILHYCATLVEMFFLCLKCFESIELMNTSGMPEIYKKIFVNCMHQMNLVYDSPVEESELSSMHTFIEIILSCYRRLRDGVDLTLQREFASWCKKITSMGGRTVTRGYNNNMEAVGTNTFGYIFQDALIEYLMPIGCMSTQFVPFNVNNDVNSFDDRMKQYVRHVYGYGHPQTRNRRGIHFQKGLENGAESCSGGGAVTLNNSDIRNLLGDTNFTLSLHDESLQIPVHDWMLLARWPNFEFMMNFGGFESRKRVITFGEEINAEMLESIVQCFYHPLSDAPYISHAGFTADIVKRYRLGAFHALTLGFKVDDDPPPGLESADREYYLAPPARAQNVILPHNQHQQLPIQMMNLGNINNIQNVIAVAGGGQQNNNNVAAPHPLLQLQQGVNGMLQMYGVGNHPLVVHMNNVCSALISLDHHILNSTSIFNLFSNVWHDPLLFAPSTSYFAVCKAPFHPIIWYSSFLYIITNRRFYFKRAVHILGWSIGAAAATAALYAAYCRRLKK